MDTYFACGDVEPNPGPDGGSEDRKEFSSGDANSGVPAQSNQASLDRLNADMAHTLNQAAFRMGTANLQQGIKTEERLSSAEDKIDR